MRFSFRAFLFLLVIGLLAACKQDTDQVEPKLISWQPHQDFLFDRKVQLSSYADSNIIILSGIQTTAIAYNQSVKPDTVFTHYDEQAGNNGRTDYRPLLSPTFFAFLYNSSVHILQTRSPEANESDDWVSADQLDSEFAYFYPIPIRTGETMVANKRNQFIVPYNVYDRTYPRRNIDGSKLMVMLVSLTVSTEAYGNVKVSRIQKIALPGFSTPRSLCGIGDNFCVSTGSGTYCIKPDGSVTKTYPYSLIRQFSFNKVTYGITTANTGSLQLVASTDQGETWATIASNIPDSYRLLNYKQVGKQLIASYNSQLFQLKITPTTLTATELDNNGLETNQITSVAQFRNTVYVSTLSGVFTKPVRTFLTPKKEQ